MKKKLMSKMLGVMVLSMALQSIVFAQADTVEVPTLVDGVPLGAINKFIQGDTTSAGERTNLDRVYKLTRGSIYYVDGGLTTGDWKLSLYGEPDDPNSPTRPPVIAPGIKDDGSSAGLLVQLHGDGDIKNVAFMGLTAAGNNPISRTLRIMGDSTTVVIDNVHFEHNKWLIIDSRAVGPFITIRNSYFRNNENEANPDNGRALRIFNRTQMVEMYNNTLVGNNSRLFDAGGLVDSLRLEHNTVVNMLGFAVNDNNASNAVISNNIFYDTFARGQSLGEAVGDVDTLAHGLIALNELDSTALADLGIVAGDRKVTVENNNYFMSTDVLAFWTATDSLIDQPFMNTRTQGMFDDATTYPNLEVSGTLALDPGFTTPPPAAATDSMITWITDWRDTTAGSFTGHFWGWNPDDDFFGIQWPEPEDFSYPTASALYTAGSGGFPLGDLNWFPERKADWETYMATLAVDDNGDRAVPEGFRLAQNYPNPFNPVTTIQYEQDIAAKVTLTIYNLLGQNVQTLVNVHQQPGAYTVRWNGLNSSGFQMPTGIYYYRLTSGAFSEARKMVLLK